MGNKVLSENALSTVAFPGSERRQNVKKKRSEGKKKN
jgi:hypothetical protein